MNRIIVHFDFPQGTEKQYDAVWDDLRASGNEHPQGLLFHTGAPKPDGGWFVVDLWESEQAFQSFTKTLMPFIERQNLPMVQPHIMQAHFVYQNVYHTEREEALA